MKVSDLDYEASIPADLPARYDEWPVGPGDGRLNRVQDAGDGNVIIGVVVTPQGYVSRFEMPERSEETGGFEGWFGSWDPVDIESGPMADYPQDLKDQLSSLPLGTNGPYTGGTRTIEASDLPGGTWPADSDLTAKQARDWMAARGNQQTAALFEQIDTEING